MEDVEQSRPHAPWTFEKKATQKRQGFIGAFIPTLAGVFFHAFCAIAGLIFAAVGNANAGSADGFNNQTFIWVAVFTLYAVLAFGLFSFGFRNAAKWVSWLPMPLAILAYQAYAAVIVIGRQM